MKQLLGPSRPVFPFNKKNHDPADDCREPRQHVPVAVGVSFSLNRREEKRREEMFCFRLKKISKCDFPEESRVAQLHHRVHGSRTG
jgi:hypothetical protein